MRVAVRAVALALAGLAAWPSGSAAQSITADGTMGTAVANGGPAYTISGGTVRGNNLFHSFQAFSVFSGESASFQGAASTANVLSRVTGGAMSTIDGAIDVRSAMPSANFFFMNPSGVLLGPGAFLDVGGSVHFTTADRILFPDGVFSATPLPDELNLLSSAPPQAFGFLSDSPAPITLEGAVLFVDPGQTLSIVGGDVSMTAGAVLAAPGGVVQIVSVGSPGTVDVSAPNVTGFARLGTVTIAEGSVVAASDPDFIFPGGTVVIRSGQLVVDTGALILSGTSDSPAATVGIDIEARESMTVREGALVQTISTGTENAGSISIKTGDLTVTDVGSAIESQAFGSGMTGAIGIEAGSAQIVSGGVIRTVSGASNAGDVSITATGTLTLAGAGSLISTGAGAGSTDPDLVAGNITLSAADILLSDSAEVRSGDGAAGEQVGARVGVTAANTLSISSLAGISSRAFSQSAGTVEVSASQVVLNAGYIVTSTFSTGNAGTILVNANSVSLTNGAQIASSSQLGTPGAGGSIVINAPGSLTISGIASGAGVGDATFTGSANSGLFSTAGGAGNAGQIALSTPALTLANGGRISVATEAAGNAGTIVANVGNFGISGGGRVDSSTTAGGAGGAITVNGALSIAGAGSGLFSTASSAGNAGAITVTGPSVTVTGGGRIDSSTTAAGAGGAIAVSGLLSIGGAGSGLFSTTQGIGNAGQIALSTPVLTLADGGRISVTTEGAGNAGTIVANVGSFGISGGARVDSSTSAGGAGGAIVVNGTLSIGGAGSGLFSTASSTGNAGAITVTAPSVTVGGGGRIDSSTTAGGAGGAIIVNGTLSVGGAGSGLFSTASSTGNAGAINVTGPNVTVADAGTIDSGTTGAGAGGAIELNAASQVEIASGGSVKADSLGSGLTGNVTISAGDQIVMSDGSISTRAVTSDGGNITLRAPNVIRLGDSQITTSVESGTGSGGNIFIDPKLVLLQGSTITANAFGGPGGSITIIADNFITDAASLVQASSALSTPGTIRIQSPENNLKEAIAQLPGEFVDASRLMRAGCAARHTGATSSLAVAGRGGVPADADGYLPSFSTTGAPLARAARQEDRAQGFVLAMASWDCMR